VKVVQLTKKGKDIVLQQLGMTNISDDPLAKMDWDTRATLTAEAMRRVMEDAKIKTRDVYTSVSGTSVVVRYIKLPYMSEQELRNTIRIEAEDYIPFNIEEVVIDFQILGQVKEEGEEKIKVLLVAAKNEVIQQHLEMLRMAKLNSLLINVDTFAIEDAWHLSGDGETGVVALVEIGSTSTNINIIENGVSCFNRDAIIGGNDFTEAIQKAFSLSFKEADAMKREKGRILLAGEERPDEEVTKISSALEGVAGKLLSELNRSFAYYYTQSHGGSIDKVVLSGGTARLPNLDRFLANGLGAQIVIANPFAKVMLDPSRFNLSYIQGVASSFTVGVGLAYRGLEEK
jgi:type IV pilus assembly protein PilM